MEIKKTLNGETWEVAVEGRLDTTTAPQLEETLNELFNDAECIILDFEKLDYISSAGLRVLLSAQKILSQKSGMTIRNVNETIMEIFEITGFIEILTIES